MSHDHNVQDHTNSSTPPKYKHIRPKLIISEEYYTLLKRYIEVKNDEHKAFCERHGFPFVPFDRDVLIVTLLNTALHDWDKLQQKIEADEHRRVAAFGPPPPSWLDDIQVEGA